MADEIADALGGLLVVSGVREPDMAVVEDRVVLPVGRLNAYSGHRERPDRSIMNGAKRRWLFWSVSGGFPLALAA
ncbi:MAG TPA: hypothetical protein VFC39_16985 [Acidobacteriaceae bacterium]|nr:hypothetical protein [Acidobacteriaceae bacterium]